MKDISGKKYNNVTVIKPIGKNKENRTIWLCLCNCGNETKAYKNQLEAGHKLSCGCIRGEKLKTHGMRNHYLYSIWQYMLDRCSNLNHEHYKDYGGRGISVCLEWHDINNFINDMHPRIEGASIDRINNNGNYCKENCRWATTKEQGNNKRDTIFITYKNQTKCITDWADFLGIKRRTIYMRHRRKYSIEEIINGKK